MAPLVMGRTPKHWVGELVCKLNKPLAPDGQQPLLLRGRVLSYVSGTAQFIVRFENGDSEGLSHDELEDIVPIVRQLRPKRPQKRDSSHLDTTNSPLTKQQKRETPGSAQPHPKLRGASTLALRLVRDLLWALTTFPSVGEPSNLHCLLDEHHDKPDVALAWYVEAGGLVTMAETLRTWACASEDSASGRDAEAAGLAFLLKLIAELPGHTESLELHEKLEFLAAHSERGRGEDDANSLTEIARWAMSEWERAFAATATSLGTGMAASEPPQAPLPIERSNTPQKAPESRTTSPPDDLKPTDELSNPSVTSVAAQQVAAAPRARTSIAPAKSKSLRRLDSLVGGRRAAATSKPGEHKVMAIATAALERQRQRAQDSAKPSVPLPTSHKTPATTTTATMGLACDDDRNDEKVKPESDNCSIGARRRLRFGKITSVYFLKEEPVWNIQQRLHSGGYVASSRSPAQNGGPYKSPLKTHCN